jgi:hypothetical protein
MMRKGDRFRVGWCQLFNQQGVLHLGVRCRHQGSDAAWILAVYDNKTDASIRESIVAARFGLPTIPFTPVDGANHLTAEAIEKFFIEIEGTNHTDRASACLFAHGRDIDHPFYDHAFQQRQGRTTIFVTQASNLIPELMMIPVYTGDRDPVWSSIDLVKGTIVSGLPVHSLQIEDNETYVADGLVTHNSIYSFRGAATDSIPKLRDRLGAKTMPLTVTWRCPRSHVELARELVPDFEAAPNAAEGTIERGRLDLIDSAGPGDMVLCRANAPIVSACLHAVANRRRAYVRGRAIGDSLLAVVRKLNDPATILEMIRNLARWRAQEIARLDAKDGTEDLIEQVEDRAACLEAIASSCSSPAEVPGVIGQLFADGDANGRITFSSVHRAKGSEARNVTYIQVPYSEKRDRVNPPQDWEISQRRNLRYVALTRSMDRLTLVS